MNVKDEEKMMDQANELREIMDDKEEPKDKLKEQSKDSFEEIDILNLPPRKEVHKNSGKSHFRFSKPLIRFLSVILVLIAIIAWVLAESNNF